VEAVLGVEDEVDNDNGDGDTAAADEVLRGVRGRLAYTVNDGDPGWPDDDFVRTLPARSTKYTTKRE